MGRCKRSTGAAALLPIGLGLTSPEEHLVNNSVEATSQQGVEVAGANHRKCDSYDPIQTLQTFYFNRVVSVIVRLILRRLQ